MNKGNLEIFIENKHPYRSTRIYVYDEENYYTFENGNVVSHKDDHCSYPDDKQTYFLDLPIWFFDRFSQAISKHVESRGGIVSEQLQKGKIERLESESNWLRSQIEKIIK